MPHNCILVVCFLKLLNQLSLKGNVLVTSSKFLTHQWVWGIVPIFNRNPISLLFVYSRSYSWKLTERHYLLILLTFTTWFQNNRLICAKFHMGFSLHFFFFFKHLFILLLYLHVSIPFLPCLVMHILIRFHLADLLLHSKVIVDSLFHGIFFKHPKQMMHERNHSIPSIHKSWNLFVAHSHPLILLFYKVLAIRIFPTVGNTCFDDNTLIHYTTRKNHFTRGRWLSCQVFLQNRLLWSQIL